MADLSSEKNGAGASQRRSRPRLLFKSQKGSVLFYIFLAIGLLAALTYSFVRDSQQNVTSHVSYRASEELYVQLNVIRSAVAECALEYPGGGGDLNLDGVIDATDNANNPYPINPSSALNPNAPAGCTTTSSAAGCVAAAANNNARNMTCIGAPIGKTNIFQGASNKGRLLPPPPTGFSEWLYTNDATGVYLTIDATGTANINALTRLVSHFATCQAEMADADTFRAWIQRATCP